MANSNNNAPQFYAKAKKATDRIESKQSTIRAPSIVAKPGQTVAATLLQALWTYVCEYPCISKLMLPI